MRMLLLLTALLLFAVTARAVEPPITVTVTGTPASHTIRWTTRPCYNYQLQVSPNLLTWTTVGGIIAGPGDTLQCSCTSPSPPPRLYYRVKEINPGFFTRPLAGATYCKESGICFAFELSRAPSDVVKICICKRPTGTSAWTLIGTLTDITTLKGVKTLRGPAVWLPGQTGSCDVKVEGKNASGVIRCTETRQITLVANTPPTVSVTAYTAAGSNPGTFAFATTVSDPDAALGDAVTRIAYYDNDVLIGTDYAAPFGAAPADPLLNAADGILNTEAEHYFSPNSLLRGLHSITAKAYDTRGAAGDTLPDNPLTPQNEVFTVDIPTGLARPSLNIPAASFYRQTFPGGDLETNFGMISHNNIPGITGHYLSTLPTTGGGFQFVHDTDPLTIDSFIINGINLSAGQHTYICNAREPAGGPRSYDRTFDVLCNTGQFINGEVMAGLIADPATCPVVNFTTTGRFYGAYAAAQPYTGGTAAGLDASTFPASARRMDTGIHMSTGLFSTWDDNNAGLDKSYQWYTPGDKVIHDRIAGSYNRDACTLEFDVNCLHSQLEMELQFGSEEYPFYIGDPAGLAYDAMAVTVDGTLLSLVPDGGAPISVKSIHPFAPEFSTQYDYNPDLPALRGHLYLHDDTDINAAAGANTQVEFNGMSVRFRLHAFVTPGVHRVRISIADRDYPLTTYFNRAKHDSGIFIRTGSLRTIAPTP